MKLLVTTFCTILLLTFSVFCAQAQTKVKMSDEPVDAARWIESRFAKGKVPPFSFVCGGRPSRDFITR